ncbi:MAG TPA: polysaccharide pyruvyl transferase family protein [Candidatus Rifleibacterium sp.]|nr:polysaccharide pyruvyl transferase family protein [Candidatus Rifleibacterium sp.]HPT46736.1 polysaccharide pyruvyl transferase family protein [Candidatus Rifleibacterium sp.]
MNLEKTSSCIVEQNKYLTGKIGILTYNNVHNYGAILQMYALTRIFQSKGFLPIVLQFKRNYSVKPLEAKKKYDIGFGSIFYYLSWMIENGLRKTLFNILKFISLKIFKKRCFNLGRDYSEELDLKKVCIGSDEVFAVDVGFNPVLYGIGVPCSQIFSYAGCFGKSTYQDVLRIGAQTLIKEGLEKLQAISLRDENSQYIVEQILGKRCAIHCDPVILYGFHQEIERAKLSIDLSDYLVIYSYDNNMNKTEEIVAIKTFATMKGLKTVSVGFYHDWCDYNVVADPLKTLGWFANSSCVITDTFHGSILSIITRKKFATLVRENKNKAMHLLSSVSLEDRILKYIDEMPSVIDKDIDYDCVEEKINAQRKSAQNYIEGCLNR